MGGGFRLFSRQAQMMEWVNRFPAPGLASSIHAGNPIRRGLFLDTI
jgi:hypothetical protein